MRAVCVVASILAGASADIGGCVLDPSGPNACREGSSLADSASLLQVKATERVQDQSEAAALTQNAAASQRCSDSPDDPCAFTPWTPWSGCSKACGTGIETRTRQTLNPEKCKKECIKEAQTCNVEPCTTPPPGTTVPPDHDDPPPSPPTKMCQIYGDPHFIAFDGHLSNGDTARLTAKNGEGVLWAVKSDELQIQVDASGIRSGPGTGWGRAKGLAVNGSALGSHRLVFIMDGKKTLLNGQEIVKENGTTYKSDDGLVEVEHMATLDPNNTEWQELGYGDVNISDKVHNREAWAWRLAKKITIYFSEGDSLCAIIRMPKVEGMDGLCGNFDGIRDNDLQGAPSGKHEISTRMGTVKVAAGENLFEEDGHPSPPSFTQEVTSGRTMEDCEPERKKEAEEKCAEIREVTFRHGCVYDICKTGDLQDEKDEVAEEVLDTIARTVPGLP